MSNTIAIVLAALIQIETGGHPDPANAVGDNGAAIGILQLHTIYVEEANRVEQILARRQGRAPRSWNHGDRRSRERSLEITGTMLEWHWSRGERDPVRLGARHHRPYGDLSPRYLGLMERALTRERQ